MFIELDQSDGDRPRLAQPADFTAFKIVIAGARDRSRVQRALAPVADLLDDGEYAMVRIDALATLAGPLGEDADWRASLAGMVDYARSKGWVDDAEPVRVRAHLEWED